MPLDVHFSSKTVEWETPQYFFDDLNREFKFELDVAASTSNHKCDRYCTIDNDGLLVDWHRLGETPPTCWMNPPYGRQIGKWVEKGYLESQLGCVVVCLLPARTDTAWFHDYILDKAEIRFIRRRLKFGGSANSAPFPSMVCVYRANMNGGLQRGICGSRKAAADAPDNNRHPHVWL
jgi:phage N-6-adenine-methyltransferase